MGLNGGASIELIPRAATFIALLLVIVAKTGICSPARAKGQDGLSLPQVVEKTLAFHFAPAQLKAQTGLAEQPSLAQFVDGLPVAKHLKHPAGVFVTLSRGGKSRACWGSIFPEHRDLVKATVYATLGALTKEYRYAPIRRDEWQLLKPQVTVVQSVEPVSGLAGQNPLRCGLMVRARGKTAVILPGEARDAHYQLVQCKLKAGIKPGEPCQLYSIKADVYD